MCASNVGWMPSVGFENDGDDDDVKRKRREEETGTAKPKRFGPTTEAAVSTCAPARPFTRSRGRSRWNEHPAPPPIPSARPLSPTHPSISTTATALPWQRCTSQWRRRHGRGQCGHASEPGRPADQPTGSADRPNAKRRLTRPRSKRARASVDAMWAYRTGWLDKTHARDLAATKDTNH